MVLFSRATVRCAVGAWPTVMGDILTAMTDQANWGAAKATITCGRVLGHVVVGAPSCLCAMSMLP